MKFWNILFVFALFMSVGVRFLSCSEDEPIIEPEAVNDWNRLPFRTSNWGLRDSCKYNDLYKNGV